MCSYKWVFCVEFYHRSAFFSIYLCNLLEYLSWFAQLRFSSLRVHKFLVSKSSNVFNQGHPRFWRKSCHWLSLQIKPTRLLLLPNDYQGFVILSSINLSSQQSVKKWCEGQVDILHSVIEPFGPITKSYSKILSEISQDVPPIKHQVHSAIGLRHPC